MVDSQVNIAMFRADWKEVAYSTGLAVLSALVVGLFVQNRRLSLEVRKKHEVGMLCGCMLCDWHKLLWFCPNLLLFSYAILPIY